MQQKTQRDEMLAEKYPVHPHRALEVMRPPVAQELAWLAEKVKKKQTPAGSERTANFVREDTLSRFGIATLGEVHAWQQKADGISSAGDASVPRDLSSETGREDEEQAVTVRQAEASGTEPGCVSVRTATASGTVPGESWPGCARPAGTAERLSSLMRCRSLSVAAPSLIIEPCNLPGRFQPVLQFVAMSTHQSLGTSMFYAICWTSKLVGRLSLGLRIVGRPEQGRSSKLLVVRRQVAEEYYLKRLGMILSSHSSRSCLQVCDT